MRDSGVTLLHRRAFTLVELLIILVVLAVIAAVIVVTQMPRGSAMRDATQVRGILQGMVIWAGNNQDRYPLPSLVDVNNATVAEQGAFKDTTANIYSMLIWTGALPVDLCVSPSEVNRNIAVMEGYEFKDPRRAVKPAEALWDPAFSADFTAGPSHFSYAHRPPAGPRLKEWANTFNPLMPVIGNRGPQIASATKGKPPKVSYTLARPGSNTLLIHGSRNKWEGSIGYNDNHVNFETATNGTTAEYADAAGVKWSDNLFYDEPDDPTGANAFLGVFIKAGPAPSDFVSIWD